MVSKLKFWMLLVFMASVILPESLRAEVIDKVIAVVNGQPITLSEFNEREAPLVRQISEAGSGDERDKRIADIRKKIMDSLIEDLLLEQEAERSGMKVSERDIDDAILDVKKQNSLNDEALRDALKREGLTYEMYRIQIKRQIEKSRVIGQQVRAKITVTDRDLAEYYDRNQRLFMRDEEVRVSHILFLIPDNAPNAEIEKIKKRALEVLEMARKGRDFPELARKYSQDASGKEGGSLGFFRKGQILPAFEEAAFSLKKGEMSDLVKTPFGLHIIRVDDIKEASPEPFDFVKDKIRSTLTSEMMEQRYREWMEELKRLAVIEMKL